MKLLRIWESGLVRLNPVLETENNNTHQRSDLRNNLHLETDVFSGNICIFYELYDQNRA